MVFKIVKEALNEEQKEYKLLLASATEDVFNLIDEVVRTKDIKIVREIFDKLENRLEVEKYKNLY